MLVNMMVKNNTIISIPLITGDTDEVRVQSEEPDSEKPAYEQAFCFLIAILSIYLYSEIIYAFDHSYLMLCSSCSLIFTSNAPSNARSASTARA